MFFVPSCFVFCRVVKTEDVEYTTAKSLSDQGSSQDDDLLDDFDARLQSTKK